MNFLDLNEVKENSFEVLPAGLYILNIADAIVVDTKDGQGQYIKCTFLVMQGEYADRKIFGNFNIKNKNEKAVEIGLGQLKTMMKASGRTNFTLNSVEELCGMIFQGKVGIKQSLGYSDQNEIKGYLPCPENATQSLSSNIPF